ncbi:galactose-1-phosphate uridylyltransferase [Escherichia coli]
MTENRQNPAGANRRAGKNSRGCRSSKTKVRRWAATNPHPARQIWANSFLPNEAEREDRLQKKYFAEQKSPMLVDYVQRELANGSRTVVETEHWLAVAPYWLPGRSKRYCCPKPTFCDHRFDRRPAQRFGAGVEKADQSL